MINIILIAIVLILFWVISTIQDYKFFMNKKTRKYVSKEKLVTPEEAMKEFGKINAIEILLFVGGLIVGSVFTYFGLW